LFPFIQVTHALALFPYLLKHWFLAFVRSRYSNFLQGTQKNPVLYQNNFFKQIRKIIYEFFIFLFFVGSLISFNILFIHFNLMWQYLWLYIGFNFVFGTFAFSFLCAIFLFLISFISNNKSYDANHFVYVTNKVLLKEKIKNKFYNDFKHLKRLC
jgi:hypothetical protein